ncbi:protein cutoff [Drosophila innubila]|uniref:protein cutoff n=1 Tax=Drosophila innubila TaxID=198719 RepID=UPI00148B6F4F|nr:protein cutoff [Drosophila innubila]
MCPISLNAPEDAHQSQDDAKDFCTSSIYLDNMFFFLRHSSEKIRAHLEHEFVCSRKVLELIICAPYDYNNNWTLAVSKYRNTIYMCQLQNEAFGVPLFDHGQLKKAMWMKKLRQHFLESRPLNVGQIEVDQQTNECGQFYGVFSMAINGMRLLFDAPVLANRCPNTNTTEFVDLQLRSGSMNRKEWAEYNLTEGLKLWAQTFLVGIQNIYFAYYNSEGIVQRIKTKTVRELYEDCRNDWSANWCATFLARFLDTIRKLMATVDCPDLVYMFDYDAKNGTINYRVAEDRNQHSFIPDWYKNQLRSL